jgi:hypothetical protein
VCGCVEVGDGAGGGVGSSTRARRSKPRNAGTAERLRWGSLASKVVRCLCCAAGRLLELVLLLERHWAEHRLTYPLVLLSAMAYRQGPRGFSPASAGARAAAARAGLRMHAVGACSSDPQAIDRTSNQGDSSCAYITPSCFICYVSFPCTGTLPRRRLTPPPTPPSPAQHP